MESKGLLWDTGRDEEVQVNQRALIDKVLARYSGEYTVLRELLQNSDDAAAKKVEIHFNTKTFFDNNTQGAPASQSLSVQKPGLPDLKTQLLHHWSFRNDGIPFRDEDWNRLKKIAEGNPDEQKIGAFGVGFYSLFSVTDEPFVKSGGQWMGFYWKDNKDQLYARRGSIPHSGTPGSDDKDSWTSFDMPLRDPSSLPGRPVDIARFLATSLTFMTHLREVSMYFDSYRLVHISKDIQAPVDLSVPKQLNATSPRGIMTVKGIQSSDLHISADILRWVYVLGTEKPQVTAKPAKSFQGGSFFSSLFSSFGNSSSRPLTPEPSAPTPKEEDLLEHIESTVLLTVYSAEVGVRLDKKMHGELERATKKKPPSTSRYSLIYTGKEEYDASKKEDERSFKATGSVFQGLRADLEGTGAARVFIGHATSQQTGIGGHVSARFIPTVERESIDLVDRNVSVWNKELLYIGGFLARAVYEIQVSSLQRIWSEAIKSSGPAEMGIDADLRQWIESKCLHALRFFTFYPTSPSPIVSQDMEAAFFASSKDRSFSIISSAGVQNAKQVRYYDAGMATFLKKLPMLSDSFAKEASLMVNSLRERGMIQDVTFADVLVELGQRSLSEEEMIECLKWRVSLDTAEVKGHDQELKTRFLNAAVFTTSVQPGDEPGSSGPPERVVPLASIRTILSPGNAIPPNVPLPNHTLPFSVSKSFRGETLQNLFGWRELSLVDWVEFLVSSSGTAKPLFEVDQDVAASAVFAERVLNTLAKGWPNLSKQNQLSIVAVLQNKTVVPTRSGMKTPREAYFANANVFPDLPIVTLPKGTTVKGNLEKVLTALGVMKHVDLQIVFTRMMSTGDWGIQELMKYLVAVQGSLTPQEVNRLRHTAAFPRERDPNSEGTIQRLKPSDLYEPIDSMRELDLPVLAWGTGNKWRSNSDEAKMLFDLGLQRYPSLATVLGLAAGPNPDKRKLALKYFLDNFQTKYTSYDPKDFVNVAFVPSVKSDGTAFMAKPNEVFVDPGCAFLGFPLVHEDLRAEALTKLRLTNDPPTRLLMPLLLTNSPRDVTVAQRYFEYLTNRIADFTPAEFVQLANTPMIPAYPPSTSPSKENSIQLYKPTETYFRNTSRTSVAIHSKLFPFVDFGSKANNWLRACGVRDEPTVPQIAALWVDDPKKFLELAGGSGGYLEQLRNIATYPNLPSDLMARMKRTPFLLGSRREPRQAVAQATKFDADDGDDDYETTFDLLRPNEIVIVDDTNAYSLFSDTLFGAPQEDIIEVFYMLLGSSRLTSLIKEEYRPNGIESSESRLAQDTRNLVIQRFPLLLHERNVKCRIKPEWLAEGTNFQVRGCSKLTLIRTLEVAGKRLVKAQDASAAARMVSSFTGSGPLMLYVSKNDKVDMYEVAQSMCKLLLKNPRVNDSLLFMTILSTDLRALRRRGFNVDRILHQQKVERELLEARRVAETKNIEQQQVQAPAPATGPPPPKGATESLPWSRAGALNSIKEKIQTQRQSVEERLPSLPGFWPSSRDTSSPVPKTETPPRNPTAQVTPTSDIEKNIKTAIAACRSENSSVLANRQQMTKVKESSEGGYCDVSGTEKDFDLLGAMKGYKFFVARDVVNPREVVASKQDVIGRFAEKIITPLVEVYRLSITSVHIFYDQQGDLIAFNRGGGLFLNLRYYESWHDSEVKDGKYGPAWISWYHTLAHEIAHNLVQPHNSEHEFYFSALCEGHLVNFIALMNRGIP